MISSEKNPRKATMLRIDPELYALLKQKADSDSRSVNQQIVYYVRQGLQHDLPLSSPRT